MSEQVRGQWVANHRLDDEEDDYVLRDYIHRFHPGNDFSFGSPKSSDRFTSDELSKMGYRGVYVIADGGDDE